MSSKQLTDTQRQLAKTLDIATQSCIDYAAPEVPALGNATPEGLLEEFGRLNEARKALEKVEKIVRVQFLNMVQKNELRGDNYNFKTKVQERNALDQTKAKAVLGEIGRLQECMSCTEVTAVTVKRN